jgi:hypothetical protein
MWLQMCHSKRKSKKALYFVPVARASFLFSFSFFGLGMFNSPCTQVKQDSDDGFVVHCGDDGDHRGSGLDVDRSRRQVGLGGWVSIYASGPQSGPVLNQFHGDAAAAAALARLQPYYQQLSLLCLLSRA